MTACLLVDLDIFDAPGFAAYRAAVMPLIEKHRGQLTHRLSQFEAIEGNWSPSRMVIIEFPSKELARHFLDDPDYVPVKDMRVHSANSLIAMAEVE